MIFQYGLEPVLIQRILTGFGAILESKLPEPILNSCGMSLVLLREYEPDKLCVGHPSLPLGGATGHGSAEDALDHPAT